VSEDLLRLEADDPEVLRLTALALQDSNSPDLDPPLRIVCNGYGGKPCGVTLARAGDTNHGPLFTSSWKVTPDPGHVIVHNGRQLKPWEARDWIEEHEELVYREGRPLRDDIRHGVRALLKPGLRDYPNLLVVCEKHGDAVLDREKVVSWLREAVNTPRKLRKPVPIEVNRREQKLNYRPPQLIPGEPVKDKARQAETRKLPFTPMPLEEFKRRQAENHRRSDTPGAP
jgi:hypothetical protein